MKTIREALEELERHATTDCGTVQAAMDVQRKYDAARAEMDVMEARLAALEAFAHNLSSTVESDFANEEAHGKGGMRPATLTGDFARLPPSAKSRLRWWAERAKEALATGKEKPK